MLIQFALGAYRLNNQMPRPSHLSEFDDFSGTDGKPLESLCNIRQLLGVFNLLGPIFCYNTTIAERVRARVLSS